MHNVRAHQFLAVAEKMLDGELSYRCGDLKDAFESLRKAVRLEDELPYDEPWGWMSPTRHALGALLLESGHVSEAEAVFRKDLERYPMNLWSLTGLLKCVKDDDVDEKRRIRKNLAIASARADIPVGVACFCANAEKPCCGRSKKKRKVDDGGD
jgi:tetratricopeptide (TPR) repeat protein